MPCMVARPKQRGTGQDRSTQLLHGVLGEGTVIAAVGIAAGGVAGLFLA